MKIENNMSNITYEDINYGDMFCVSIDSSIYLKTPSVVSINGTEFNAVNLELGTVTHFDYDKAVWPVKGRLIISGGGTLI